MNKIICISLISLILISLLQGVYSMQILDDTMTYNEISNFNTCIDIDDEIEKIIGEEKTVWFNPLWHPPDWFRKVMSKSILLLSILAIGYFFYKEKKNKK
ncbi:MAG: hypothetical protein LRZ92_00300 [Methanosarcinaceae archaeon]|jgi:hypothetical protein|nr:hypothetical protein [Methanosarcinaceae archaeon]NKQ38285.1 hypothetical protein [Methanosarcinales archaeon]